MRGALSFLAIILASCTNSYSPALLEKPYWGAIEVRESGNSEEALPVIEAAARDYEGKGDSLKAFRAYRSAALLAEAVGNYQKMLTFAEKSYDQASKSHQLRGDGRGTLRFASYLLAKAHLAVNDPESAVPLLLSALPRKVPTTRKQAQRFADLHSALGDAMQRSGNLKAALEHHEEALRVQERVWEVARADIAASRRKNRSARPPVRDRYLRHLAAVIRDHIALGNAGHAVALAEKLMERAQEFGYRQWEAEGYRLLGDIALKEGSHWMAVVNYQKALSVGEVYVSPSVLLWSHVGLGRAHLLASKPSLAAEDFERAMGIVETQRSFLESEDLRSNFFEDKAQIYSEAVLVQLKIGRSQDAFHTSERARARAFLDLLGTRLNLSRSRELFAAESDLRRKIAELRLAISEDDEAEEIRSGRNEQAEAARKSYNEFLNKVRKEDSEQASLLTVQPLRLKQVQELLEPSQTLLEYFVTSEQIIVWVVGREQFDVLTTNMSRKDLLGKLNSLRQAIAKITPLEKYSEAAGELYRVLVQPVVPLVRGNEIIVVAHDMLHYLPFQALMSPQGKYLIEDYSLTYLSSASLLQFTKEKTGVKGRAGPILARETEKILAMGNPDLGEPEQILAYAEQEVKEIQQLYPQSTVLLGKNATEKNSKTFAPEHNILHFATHAELVENDPLGSAVLLARDAPEDGRLEVREIFGMSLKADLVVLSACDTALGKLSTGDELVGLTRAFIYAGTPSVVASLWKVDDASTAQLMSSFYGHLKTMSKSDALRQAQLEMIRGKGRGALLTQRGVGGFGKLDEIPRSRNSGSMSTSHPYFWAPFILVGYNQ